MNKDTLTDLRSCALRSEVGVCARHCSALQLYLKGLLCIASAEVCVHAACIDFVRKAAFIQGVYGSQIQGLR